MQIISKMVNKYNKGGICIKRFISLLLIGLLFVALAGCSDRGKTKSNVTSKPAQIGEKQATPLPENQISKTADEQTSQKKPSPANPKVKPMNNQANDAKQNNTTSPKGHPSIIGEWTKISDSGGLPPNAWNDPCDAVIILDQCSSDIFDLGKQIPMEIILWNSSKVCGHPLQNLAVLAFTPTVEIVTDTGTVWVKEIPNLTGTFDPGDQFSIKISWGQSDLNGNQVPPGRYHIKLIPGTLRYRTQDGTEQTVQLNAALATSNRFIVITKP